MHVAFVTDHSAERGARGEVLTRRQAFQPFLEARAFDIIQPDVTKVGGISEERVAAVKASGVGSIALVSAITASDDWQGATERLLAAVGAGDEPRSACVIREAEHAL